MKYRKADPLYGAPRGNRVMKAKRVTGESAQTILLRHMVLEHCKVKGCSEPVLVTKNHTGVTKERICAKHLGGRGRKPANISKLLKFQWQ
jgi:hypothetical protein